MFQKLWRLLTYRTKIFEINILKINKYYKGWNVSPNYTKAYNSKSLNSLGYVPTKYFLFSMEPMLRYLFMSLFLVDFTSIRIHYSLTLEFYISVSWLNNLFKLVCSYNCPDYNCASHINSNAFTDCLGDYISIDI